MGGFHCSILEKADNLPLETKCANLITWLKANDPKFVLSSNLEIQRDEYNGIGLFYAKNLHNSNEILYISSSVLINKLTCMEFFKLSMNKCFIWNDIFNKYISLETVDESWNSFQVIILYMYIEWFCQTGDNEGFHLPFFQTLPSHRFFEENIPVLQYLQFLDVDETKIAEVIRENMNLELKEEFEKLLGNIRRAEEILLPILGNIESNTFLIKKRIRYLYMCINSRCLYYEIKRNNLAKEDNLTLVPLVDFINHTNIVEKQNSFVDVTNSMDLSRKDYKLLVHQDKLPNKLNQLLFTYGSHCDSLLLNDYGFILNTSNEHNHLDVTDIIVNKLKEWEIEYLKQINFYNDGDQFLINADKQTPFFNTQLAVYVISLNMDFNNLNNLKTFPKIKQIRLSKYIKTMENTDNYEKVLKEVLKAYNDTLYNKMATLKLLPKCPNSIIDLMEKYYIQEKF